MLDLKGKKAISLLRVSTDKQTTKDDDIPSQRTLVNGFIEKEEVILIREFVEGGVSGFKTKIAKRDALQTIKKMADNKEFDVLVTYKSDRIGRTTDESPLVVKYLNEKNIRVFTASGQELKTETLMDELVTYLEFWRNKGESVKISERSTDYKKVAILNGKYTGGSKRTIPFGYRVVNNGNVNEKGRNILDFEVDPEDAELVKLIFKLSIGNNMGARSIAKWLNENGHASKSKNGEYWSYRSITYMLNNPIYKGYFHMHFDNLNEDVISPQQEHLIIIPEVLWEKNQKIIENRKRIIKKKPEGITSSRVLLSGLVYCGHCESKMNLWANHKYYKKKNGERTKYIKDQYKCYSSLKYNGDKCDGQKTYSTLKIDSIVEEQAMEVVRELSEKKFNDRFKKDMFDSLNILIKNKKDNQKKLESKQRQLIVLKKEIPLAMIGESTFSPDELKESLSLIQKDVNDLLNYMNTVDEQILQKQSIIDEYDSLEKGISTWEDRYKETDMLGKKALINQIIDKVTIYRDEVVIDYKITFETFKKESSKNYGSEIGPSYSYAPMNLYVCYYTIINAGIQLPVVKVPVVKVYV